MGWTCGVVATAGWLPFYPRGLLIRVLQQCLAPLGIILIIHLLACPQAHAISAHFCARAIGLDSSRIDQILHTPAKEPIALRIARIAKTHSIPDDACDRAPLW